jgi:murein tripeptide amidase MpaA
VGYWCCTFNLSFKDGSGLTGGSQTAEYLAFNLLSNYATDANIKAYVDKYDFYIFPVVNPDGKSE